MFMWEVNYITNINNTELLYAGKIICTTRKGKIYNGNTHGCPK